MIHQMRILQGLKVAAVLAVALSMGACANKNGMGGADGAMAGAATPGSQQDFVVNVGDRVFFESDQTELSPQAIATLEKQARWLQSYNRYAFTIEGHADERGTREYNIALGARRAQSVRTFLASRGSPWGRRPLWLHTRRSRSSNTTMTPIRRCGSNNWKAGYGN